MASHSMGDRVRLRPRQSTSTFSGVNRSAPAAPAALWGLAKVLFFLSFFFFFGGREEEES